MRRGIFSTLLLTGFTTVFLLSIRSFPIPHNLFASAVRTIHHCGDHVAFHLSNNSSSHFTTAFSFLPLPIIVALAAQQAGRPDLIRSPKRVLAHTWEGLAMG